MQSAQAVDIGGSDQSAGGAAPSGLDAARADIDAGRYNGALRKLTVLAQADPGNADVWNLLGFSSRKLGDYAAAASHYDKALSIDAGHLGALEYQGELFLETGQAQRALANLKTLKKLCGTCEEYEDLQAAVAKAVQG